MDYSRCAGRIADALKLEPGERIVLKLDPRVFTALVEPLQKEIRKAGAFIAGVVLAEETNTDSEAEYTALRDLFNTADVFIWLPEKHQGNRPALGRVIAEWLDAKRGRAVHFHWHSGSYAIGDRPLPAQDIIDEMYLKALAVAPEDLAERHRAAIQALRAGPARVTTPDGTDISFVVGDRPFSSQTGDASRLRMQTAKTRIDRDVELPAGVLRVAPMETSANGTIFLPVWRPLMSEGRRLLLRFRDGHLTAIDGEKGGDILAELTAAGGAARMFREFALGFNGELRVRDEHPFIAYYGYGDGVVRLSLGDNEEMGGANRGGGVYWNFIPNATVYAGSAVISPVSSGT
jgi:leucyl aminopeptidase (aminopeptidase T)